MDSITTRKQEVDAKLNRLRERLAARKLDGVLINQTANTAWLTAGANTYVGEATEGGVATLLVTSDKAYCLTDTIEAPRLRDEEHLEALGFEFVVEPWYARGGSTGTLLAGKHIGGEGGALDFGPELRNLRQTLVPPETERLRRYGKLAGEAMDKAIRAVRPGDSEFLLAGRLSEAARERGGSPIVTLVASDERIFNFRHPLPADKKVEKYAMLVLCFRAAGLVISVTRLVHFGKLPQEIADKAQATARIDAKVILGTRPGRTLGDMFNLLKEAYREEGYPEAIEEHHQGGTAGYLAREVLATPAETTPIHFNQVFAWNPSIRGVKSEDTVLLTDHSLEVVTEIAGWPTWDVTVDGHSLARPAILEA